MLSIDEILAKAELITLETQIDSITPMRVGELFTSLAEQLRLGVGAGATIGASKLSELADVMLLNNKDNDILQKIGTKWTNIQLDLNKINQISSFWKLDANGNLYTDLNVYSTQGVSAYGAGPDGAGGATGYDRLDAWSLYTNDKSGWVLSALLGKELHDRVLVLEDGGGGGIGTEIDPTVAAHIKNITTGDITNWATAYAKSHEHDNISILNATTASFLTADRNKLDGIAAGAQVNVQANWDAVSGAAAILNKPYALPASDVYAWAKEATKPSYNFSDIASKPTTLSGYGITDGLSISIYTAHKSNQNTEKHVTADDLNVLNHLSIVNGALQADIDFYSTGGVSAYGLGSTGGSGGVGSLVTWGITTTNYAELTVEGAGKNVSLSGHKHEIADINSLTSALAGKEPAITKLTAFNKNFGTTAGDVAEGNDSRINNGQTAFGWGNHASAGYALNSALTAHINKVDNPHTVTKTQVGLGNVDNTSDANKPVSTATQTALNLKANLASPTFTGSVTAPTFIGALTGNASSATKLQTARTIWGQSFNGTANVSGAFSGATTGVFSSTVQATTAILTNLTANYLPKHTATGLVNSSIFDNGTNVGICTTTPTATLDVNGIGKFKDDILMTFNTWSYNNWTYPTDKNSLNKFLKLFDIDTAGNLVVKTNLYSTGEVTAYKSGTGVSGLTLQGDMNANGKNITNLLSVSNQQSMITMGFSSISFDIAGYDNQLTIADDGIYANTDIEATGLSLSGTAQATEFKFGTWTFKQDGSGRLGIYNGTAEVACFNTDGTYVNL